VDRFSIATGNIPPQEEIDKELRKQESDRAREVHRNIEEGLFLEIFHVRDKYTYQIDNLTHLAQDGNTITFDAVRLLIHEDSQVLSPSLTFRIYIKQHGDIMMTPLIHPLNDWEGDGALAGWLAREGTRINPFTKGLFVLKAVDMSYVTAIIRRLEILRDVQRHQFSSINRE
jgi:hypothetical protein